MKYNLILSLRNFIAPNTHRHPIVTSNCGYRELDKGLFFSTEVYEMKWSVSCSVVSDPLRVQGLGLARLFCPWDSSGKNTGAVCHFLFQIVPNQGSHPGFLHCRQPLYHLSHRGSSKIMLFGAAGQVYWSVCFCSDCFWVDRSWVLTKLPAPNCLINATIRYFWLEGAWKITELSWPCQPRKCADLWVK